MNLTTHFKKKTKANWIHSFLFPFFFNWIILFCFSRRQSNFVIGREPTTIGRNQRVCWPLYHRTHESHQKGELLQILPPPKMYWLSAFLSAHTARKLFFKPFFSFLFFLSAHKIFRFDSGCSKLVFWLHSTNSSWCKFACFFNKCELCDCK